MKNTIRGIGFFLALTILFTCTVSANVSTNEDLSFVNFTVDYIEKENLNPNTSCSTMPHDLLPYAGTITVTGETNDIEIQINTSNNENIILNGVFYIFNSGAYAGEILGGNFETESEIVIDTVKIETGSAASTHYNNSKPILCIKYHDSDNSEGYYISEIDFAQFASLKAMATESAMLFLAAGKTQDEYNEMVTKLCFPFMGSGTNNIEPIELVYTENAEETCHSRTQEQTSVNSFVTSFENFTYDSFQDFISNIKSEVETTLSELNVSSNVFRQEAQAESDIEQSAGSPSWAWAYDSQEVDVFRYIVVSMLDYKFSRTTYSTHEEVSTQLEVKDSVYFEYLPSTGEIRYLTDTGLKVKNVDMSITKMNGNVTDVFKTYERNGRVNNDSVNIPTLLGLIPKASLFVTVCSAFTSATTDNFGCGEYLIGDTYQEQDDRYNGKVCRAIALDSGGCYIKAVGDYMKLSGKVVTDSAGNYRLHLAFSIDGFLG